MPSYYMTLYENSFFCSENQEKQMLARAPQIAQDRRVKYKLKQWRPNCSILDCVSICCFAF